MLTFRRSFALKVCILAFILALLPGKTPVSAANLDKEVRETASALSAMRSKPGQLLKDPETIHVGTTDDWIALVLADSGSREYYAEYLELLQDHVEKAYADRGFLEDVKATEYHRIALVALALGDDPTSFGQKPDGTPIDLIADGIYDFVGP